MKISVIIPAYNEEKFIARALQSLLEQTRKIDEIIVVNNNSTDATVEIAKSFGVTVINETRQGMIPARDAGFNRASGNIIARIDSDTLVKTDWAQRIEDNFHNPETVGLVGSISYADSWFFGLMNYSFLYIKVIKWISGRNVLMGPSMAIRSDVWQKIKYDVCQDDKRVHEDVDLALNVSAHGTIDHDKLWTADTSARRIVGNPISFFFEYPYRLLKTFKHNRKRQIPKHI